MVGLVLECLVCPHHSKPAKRWPGRGRKGMAPLRQPAVHTILHAQIAEDCTTRQESLEGGEPESNIHYVYVSLMPLIVTIINGGPAVHWV